MTLTFAQWHESREVDYRFVRVDYFARRELEVLDQIRVGGEIARNANTSLKESGQIAASGPVDIGDDFVRIYLDVITESGATHSEPLATLHAYVDLATIRDGSSEYQIPLQSALTTLAVYLLPSSLTITKGTNAINKAVELCGSLSIPVVFSPSAKTLSADATFDAGENSMLDVVNYLLDAVGYWSLGVDPYGRATMVPYTDPASRTPAWDFDTSGATLLMPEIEISTNRSTVPNVFILTRSNGELPPIVGVYENRDPASPTSTVNRAYRISASDIVMEADSVADLEARAKTRLATASAPYETSTIAHPYAPLGLGEVVTVAWDDLALAGSIQAQTIELDYPTTTRTELRRVWR